MREIFVAAGPNELENSENEDGKIAGFWQGLWHGMTAPFSLVISLFKEDIGIYETHNNGRKYNFGFIIGLMIVFGGNRAGSIEAYSKRNGDA
jgi:hypothetical protein